MAYQFTQTGQEIQYLLDEAMQLAEEYDSSVSYAVGDYCSHEGTLYRCTTATTGTWDASKWTSNVIVLNALRTLKGRMDTAEGEIDTLQGMALTPYFVVTTTNITTDGMTVSTYNGRKFSDYSFLVFRMGATSADTRMTQVVPGSFFQTGTTVYMTALHGSAASTASSYSVCGMSIEWTSDTSITVGISGSRSLSWLTIFGFKLTT